MNRPGLGILMMCAFSLPVFGLAQNLVPNGSFEEFTVCPGSYSRLPAEFRVPHWRSINTGSPDYFNTCSKGEADVPYNWAGVSDAFDGNGYAGIYTWMSLPKEYREYLHCKLIEPLKKDSLYHIEFRYKLSSYSRFCTDRIGILLSDSIKCVSDDLPLQLKPTFIFMKDSALTPETGSWELAAADYRAKGNEQFLTIGNFSDNATTRFYHIRFRPDQQPMLSNSAYYYIDAVRVVPAFGSDVTKDVPFVTAGDPELNTTYILKNISFDLDSYALLPVSYAELNKVARYLHDHPDVQVRLSGHTDDRGTAAYNLILSTRRAESVATYLVFRGIDRGRIFTAGYGETMPLIEGQSQHARDTNRRVEIEFFRLQQ